MSEATEFVTQANRERERPSEVRCEVTAAYEMTKAVRALKNVALLIGATERQAWLSETEQLLVKVIKIRDAMYKEVVR